MISELRRNIWLELTPGRVVMLPAILIFLVSAAEYFGPQLGQIFRVQDLTDDVLLVALGALGIFWGTRAASEAVVAEVTQRTWDMQKMTAIGPWTMTWSKLIGSTVFTWYGIAWVWLLAAALQVSRWPEFALLTISSALAQAMALFTALLVVRLEQRKLRATTALAQMLGIFIAYAHFFTGADWLRLLTDPQIQPYLDDRLTQVPNTPWLRSAVQIVRGLQPIDLYGVQISPFLFLFIAPFVQLALLIFGIYRMMRLELRYRNLPWGWIAFLAFTAALPELVSPGWFMLGNLPSPQRPMGDSLRQETILDLIDSMSGLIGLHFALAFAYAALLLEPKQAVDLRRMGQVVRTARWRRILSEVPPWASAVIVLLICAAFAALNPKPIDLSSGLTSVKAAATTLRNISNLDSPPYVIGIVMFYVRDAAFLFFVAMYGAGNRGPGMPMLLLTVLYAAPLVAAARLGLPELGHAFFPVYLLVRPTDALWLPTASALVQIGVFGFLAAYAARLKDARQVRHAAIVGTITPEARAA